MIDYITRGKVLLMILDSFQMEAYYWQCLLTKKLFPFDLECCIQYAY